MRARARDWEKAAKKFQEEQEQAAEQEKGLVGAAVGQLEEHLRGQKRSAIYQKKMGERLRVREIYWPQSELLPAVFAG